MALAQIHTCHSKYLYLTGEFFNTDKNQDYLWITSDYRFPDLEGKDFHRNCCYKWIS